MARSFTTALRLPSPQHLVPREPILASDLQAMADALNWVHARGALAFSQAWADSIFARTSNAFSASGQVQYRVPDVGGGRTVVTIHAYCTRVGAAGRLKATGFAAASSADIAIGAGTGWTTLPITVDPSGGYDLVEVYTRGDGADPVIVHSLYAEYAPLTSPIASGARGGFYAIDLDEAAADQAIAADLMCRMRDDLADLLARQRVLYTWSGLHDVDNGTTGPQAMPPWSHRAWGRITPGEEDAGRTLTIHARVKNTGASAADFVFNAGGTGFDGSALHEYRVSCAAGFDSWKVGTITPDEDSRAPGCDWPLTAMTCYPAAAVPVPAGGWQRADGDIEVRSISVWGR